MATKNQLPEPTLSRDEVERGRAQVASELDAAQAAVDAAAYRAALKQEPEHREALVAAQQRVQALRGELDGLDAVAREVGRVERRAGQEAALADLDALQTHSTRAIDAVPRAYAEASQALAAFAVAWRELLQAKEEARVAVIRANPQIVRQTGGQELSGTVQAIREQVLHEFGEALSVAGVLQRTPEQIAYNATWGVEVARQNVKTGIDQRREQLAGTTPRQAAAGQ